MNEELNNIAEPAISANVGWRQMQTLLNEHLPVKKQITNTRRIRNYASVVLLITIILFTSLQPGNEFLNIHNSGNAKALKVEAPGNLSSVMNNNDGDLHFSNLPGTSNKKPGSRLSFNTMHVLPTGQNSVLNLLAMTGKEKSMESMINNSIKNQSPQFISLPVKTTASNSTEPVADRQKNIIAETSWNLSGGLGMNTTINNPQNLQPYPVVEARYNIGAHFYIAAGISAWSPVSTSTSGISKTFYLNDTLNNMHLYNEITTYNHFHYADIPLSAGINITKKFSIQAGIQMSVLLNKKVKKVIEPYDFQSMVMGAPFTLPVSVLSPNTREYDVQVNPIDYRVITGVRYTLKKMSVGLIYQHGLRSVGSGNHVNKNRNDAFALNVLFQIK